MQHVPISYLLMRFLNGLLKVRFLHPFFFLSGTIRLALYYKLICSDLGLNNQIFLTAINATEKCVAA